MNINTTYTKIITGEDLMETAQHGSTLYPFQFYYEDLSVFDFNCIEWHWHTELEFIYIEEIYSADHFFLIAISRIS